MESHVLPQSLIFAMETRESPSFSFSAFTDIRRCSKLPIASMLFIDSKDNVPCKKSGLLSPKPVLSSRTIRLRRSIGEDD